jgi:hypothetical protein
MTTSEEERAAFEDHMRAQFPTVREDMFLDRTSDDSRYCSMVTEHAWRAWNAALSTQERPRSAMGEGEVVSSDRASAERPEAADDDRADAARYRWLKPNLHAADFAYGDPPINALVFLWPPTPVSADCNATFDAAMAAEGRCPRRSEDGLAAQEGDVMSGRLCADCGIPIGDASWARCQSCAAAVVAGRSDAKRLDWLMHRISGIELRRLGIITSAGMDRHALDSAIAASGLLPEALGQMNKEKGSDHE